MSNLIALLQKEAAKHRHNLAVVEATIATLTAGTPNSTPRVAPRRKPAKKATRKSHRQPAGVIQPAILSAVEFLTSQPQYAQGARRDMIAQTAHRAIKLATGKRVPLASLRHGVDNVAYKGKLAKHMSDDIVTYTIA